MSYIQDIDFDFHVGDSFDLTPIEGSYLIGKILALGGECYVDGNLVIITALPYQAPAPVEAPEIPAPVEPEAPGLLDAPPVEEVVEKAPAPVAEVKAPDEVVEAPIKRAEEEVITAPAPKPPVPRSRPKKTIDPVGKV